MNITVSKGSVPINVQLQEQVKQLIWNNELAPGSRLPSVREMEKFLRINRNTVARAYEQLEAEGFLVSQGARGTCVSLNPPLAPRRDEVNKFLRATLQQAMELGLSPEQCAMQLLAQAQTRAAAGQSVRILLLECNQPQLDQFNRELSANLPVQVDALLLQDAAGFKSFQDYRLVVTTFFHAGEVRELLEGSNAELVTLLLKDDLSVLMRLERLPRNTRLAIICETEHDLRNYEKSFTGRSSKRLKVEAALIENETAVRTALEGAAVVICSSSAIQQKIKPEIDPAVELICDERTLDREGINLLKQRLLIEETS